MTPTTPSRLRADAVSLNYDDLIVADNLNLTIPDGQITVIVGPNACGKSTLLRAFARLLKPAAGTIILDGQSIHALPTKDVARLLGLLPQTPTAPEGIHVVDLVARGRSPHQRLFQQWSDTDEHAVHTALAATNTLDLANRYVDELSGGQRQRVWIAMALAQQTDLLLLDEPTTYLDIAHQLEVLDLIRNLNTDQHRTIVLVLHDLNLASRYAHHLVLMRDGNIINAGPPATTINRQTIRDVFGLDCIVIDDPITATPLVIPADARSSGDNPGSATSSALQAHGQQDG